MKLFSGYNQAKAAFLKLSSLIVFLLWLPCGSASARNDHSYFNGMLPEYVEDRFDQCFDDLTAEWIDSFVDSLQARGRSRDGEPYVCLAHVIQAYQAFVAEDSLQFFRFSDLALEESKKLGSDRLYYNLLANKVGFYCNHRNSFKAQRLAELLIEEAKISGDVSGIISGYLSLGALQTEHADYRRSIISYENALKCVGQMEDHDKVLSAQLLYSIGYNYLKMGMYRRALSCFEESMAESPNVDEAYLAQAVCYFKTGDYAAFRRSFSRLENGLAEALKNSDDFIYLRAMDRALGYDYPKAFSICSEIRDDAKRDFAISDIYSFKNEWDKAFEYYRKANSAVDSLRQETYSDLLASADSEMNAAYQLHEKDEELRRTHMYVLCAAFGFLVLLIVFISVLYANRQRSQFQKKRIALIQKYNAELTRAKERAEEADRLKTMFLQNMSHDLRTPLNAIVGFSQLLGLPDGFNSEEDKEQYNSYIANNSEMLMLLFEDILNVGDIEKGNFKVDCSPTACNDLCRKILKCVEYRVPDNVELKYTTNVDDNYGIVTDGRRVQQVIVNFLTNACKHTNEGEIRLDLHVDEPERTVTFSVIDTGEGVPEDIRDTLFDRYVKRGEVDSHGLGLNICLTIAEKMGGTVSLDKSYVNGAKFDFKLNLER